MKYKQLVDTVGKSLEDEEFDQYGENMRSQFMLDPTITPVNHGSFGAVPKPVFEAYVGATRKICEFPDKEFFLNHADNYRTAVKTVSEVVNCDYENIVICENATTGMNTALRSLKWEKGDKIVISNVMYYSCKTLVDYLEYTYGVEPVRIEIELSDRAENIVAKFDKELQQPKVKVCYVDHVSSSPSVMVPVETIVPLCKKYGVISVIDGAHGVGFKPLDLSELDPDFYVSNLHKWYFTPLGCAMLYVAAKYHTMIQPFPMGYFFITEPTKEILIQKFGYLGSKQYANLLVITAAKKFRDSIGGNEKIWQYSQLLTNAAVELFTAKWGEGCIVGEPFFMFNVVPPFKVNYLLLELKEFDNGFYLRKRQYDGKVEFRMSVLIYNCLADYEKVIEFVESFRE